MKDWRIHHLRYITTVEGGTGIFLDAIGKTDLIIEHNVDGSLGRITAGLGHVKSLHNHALS